MILAGGECGRRLVNDGCGRYGVRIENLMLCVIVARFPCMYDLFNGCGMRYVPGKWLTREASTYPVVFHLLSSVGICPSLSRIMLLNSY